MEYFTDYPKEHIGKGNPYYRCKSCKRSDPEINGDITNHLPWCKYRKEKELIINNRDIDHETQT